MKLDPAAIRDLLERVVHKFGLPRIGIYISQNGESAEFSAGALASEGELRYDLASIRKLLTSLSALHLVASGALRLETPVVTHLPELAGAPGAASLQVWHLLSNTSGYGSGWPRSPQESDYFTLGGLIDFVRHAPRIFAPGTVFSYQLEDYRLIAEILRRVSGREFSALVGDLMLRPLGIDVAAGQDAPRCHFEPSSRTFQPTTHDRQSDVDDGMALGPLTTASLGTLAAALARACIGDTNLQPSPLAGAPLLLTRKTAIPVAFESMLAPHSFCAYGLGCGEYPDGTLGHGASSDGQCAALRFDGGRQLAVAITISASMPPVRDMILTAVLRLCGQPAARRPPTLQAVKFEADELAGSYYGGDEAACVEIRRRGPHLACSFPPATAAAPEDRPPLEAVFVMDNGAPVLHPVSRHLLAVFFRDPASSEPCLMLGGRAFKRWRSG
jgi:CubicO group peptidase (beta-lactamase class C family)